MHSRGAIEDLGRGDLVKVECPGCRHVALLTAEALLSGGVKPGEKVLDLQRSAPLPGLREERASRHFNQVARIGG